MQCGSMWISKCAGPSRQRWHKRKILKTWNKYLNQDDKSKEFVGHAEAGPNRLTLGHDFIGGGGRHIMGPTPAWQSGVKQDTLEDLDPTFDAHGFPGTAPGFYSAVSQFLKMSTCQYLAEMHNACHKLDATGSPYCGWTKSCTTWNILEPMGNRSLLAATGESF